jgi:uncharacterized membrane protein YccC
VVNDPGLCDGRFCCTRRGPQWRCWIGCWWPGYSGPEAYWAPITTLVITQSSLGAALAVSWQRFVGTALGAVVGAIAASYFETHALVFAYSVLFPGLICGLLRPDQASYRFAA